MRNAPGQNDPDRLADVQAGGRKPALRRARYSDAADTTVRNELARITAAMDAGDTRRALAAMEALPRVAREYESRYLLSLLPEEVRQYVSPEALLHAREVYADGLLGFSLDISKLRSPVSPEKLAFLKRAFEAGAVNGIVITAYPSAEELSRILDAVNEQERDYVDVDGDYAPKTYTLETLKRMPVTEFLVRHFEGRGASVYDSRRRIEQWSRMRWCRNGQPLHTRFEEEAGRIALSRDRWYLSESGAPTEEYKSLRAAVFKALPEQVTLGEVLGTAELAFTNVAQEVAMATPVLDDAGPSRFSQGIGTTYARLMHRSISIMNPAQFLALASAIAAPKDPSTYPAPNGMTVEVLGAIDESCIASGGADVDALYLWSGPDGADDRVRIRSVLS